MTSSLSLAPSTPPLVNLSDAPEKEIVQRDGHAFFEIDHVERYRPFLVSLVSDRDHWCFIASNGGMTAGRGSPALSLFPYYTQDKLIDGARSTGALTRIHGKNADGTPFVWRPLDPDSRRHHRRMLKSLDGTQLVFEEDCADAPLTFRSKWGFSAQFGLVRRSEVLHRGTSALAVTVVDGLQNLQTTGVSDAFQNEFSILVDAYRRSEHLPDSRLRLIYLNAAPTDRAEPSESLSATVAWTVGPSPIAHLLSTEQLESFGETEVPWRSEDECRGQRAACLDVYQFQLAPNASQHWFTVADVGYSAARADHLYDRLRQTSAADLEALLIEELAATRHGLRRLVASADGLSRTADGRRIGRHRSNVMFNIMRGGVFLDNGALPTAAFAAHLARINPPLAQEHADVLKTLPATLTRDALLAAADATGDRAFSRLAREFLPLTFSRRHGDPSRPWNRFSIQVRDRQDRPRLAYQGNWRDIFQNWETLMHSFPTFLDGALARFLNATTADGYNPYRVTQDGFEWETADPHEPWANIGYWGDHQIIYLLKLLEASQRFWPDALTTQLTREDCVYAEIPYRIVAFEAMCAHPRETIDYDLEVEARITARVKAEGADGRLLHAPDGSVLTVSLAEKLLNPLLAKLAAFIPDGGIWMNTQRPEWNDANNALVGYGVSVVTLAYTHRYLQFLLAWWEPLAAAQPELTFALSEELAALLAAETAAFRDQNVSQLSSAQRHQFMAQLGQAVSTYRTQLYDEGLSGVKIAVALSDLLTFLRAAESAVAASLRANRRPDALYHSYNLLRWEGNEAVALDHLEEMLEGQVAILSAQLLAPAEALEVVDALRQSALYRADQDSYLLYPDRVLPRFLEKNQLPPEALAESTLAQHLLADAEQEILERDASGRARFGPHLHHRKDLETALNALPPNYAELVREDGSALGETFEKLFRHQAFTGRSGAFFAYEGLGSIYWHMVSKLVFAIQEHALTAAREAPGSDLAVNLADRYREVLGGLGIHKSPAHYGAFPTDAYSHTPKHAGAQQPGMTGQVKEDILIRWSELGLRIEDGTLHFEPHLLNPEEFLSEAEPFDYVDLEGTATSLPIPAPGLAFTFCGTPILYTYGREAELRLTFADGTTRVQKELSLSPEDSAALFRRTGHLHHLTVTFLKP